ncbi:HepT-like ribonuclease domain-containing protein [Sulfuriferula nivalis]|uniref:DUF86 domain-containing protein n=1 Tax=Sulfuriferula nivalis TaxID=2675298 RepID=A0A809RLX6_9PROT|nr:HepT-like ribonuclease domain-containing protein [Sulfuriferula nivalis]BBP02556.1 DUF86 domain-containing protein [Sulfuriferula nivalis]
MNENRLTDYLDHMQRAAIMSLIIIGDEGDGQLAEFTQKHAQVPWRNMRGMHNRIAHGYFDINLDVVWDTVQTALPALLKQLQTIRCDANDQGSSC